MLGKSNKMVNINFITLRGIDKVEEICYITPRK